MSGERVKIYFLGQQEKFSQQDRSAACSTQWSSEIAILRGVQDLARQSRGGAICRKAVQPWRPLLYQ